MGSDLRITAWTADEAAALSAFETAFGDFQRLDGLMSVWREGSDVVRLNAAAGKQPVPVSADVREVLHVAHQVSDWTGGKFDVTFGALSDLWKFDHDQDNRFPIPGSPQACRSSTTRRWTWTSGRASSFSGARGCVFILAGLARVTPSIGRSTRCGELA
jgi:thiamine biosynthesis lipoprotein ApbE